MKKILFWLEATRAYSLPMSIMAWTIPFFYGVTNSGNVIYGIISLFGIISAHLGANLFDDILDYKNYLYKKQQKEVINLKKGKCKFFLNEELSIKKAILTVLLLFSFACSLGLFFVWIYKLPILIIMLITGILCLIYPKSGHFGLSEIIIGTIFSPLLFTGVYFVMTGTFSLQILWLSLGFAFVTITLLYSDDFLDYSSDKLENKKTLCTLSGNKNNAYFLYIFIVFAIYSILFFGINLQILSTKYFVVFISIIPALNTISNLQKYIYKEIENEKEFLKIMNDVQKFIAIYTLLTIAAFII